MRRREFIGSLGGAVIWPRVGRAQKSAMPVVGFLRSAPSSASQHLVAGFRQGLALAGFVEGQNVGIEYRWANNSPEQLPNLAADLVYRRVAAIVGNGLAMQVVQTATMTIPIVFVFEQDPVMSGLVASLGRPGGNVTGVTVSDDGLLTEKNLELLDEITPKGAAIAVLFDPNAPDGEGSLRNVEAAGRVLGRDIRVVKVAGEYDLDVVFAGIVRQGAGALLVTGSPFFLSQRHTLVALAARYGIPASFHRRDYAEAGGLMTYGASLAGSYRQMGVYVSRILRGASPANLPVQRPTTFELIINLDAAKELGLMIPPAILARADEVIQQTHAHAE
jgi:putative ABC transport system substrate-binding protein